MIFKDDTLSHEKRGEIKAYLDHIQLNHAQELAQAYKQGAQDCTDTLVELLSGKALKE